MGSEQGDIHYMQAQLWRDARTEGDDDGGFTLVELVVTIGLVAFLFAAVAGILTTSLKALAVQKARTQGNEIATQAIEDLQRRDFDNLVLCKAASGTIPAGLDDTVIGTGCPANLTNYGEDPCNNLNPLHAPSSEYVCRRNNIDYTVKRYIAWTDPSLTSKRLAVYVSWIDVVGRHEVSQQSSLRAPSAASIIGLASPTITVTAPGANTIVTNDDGSLSTSLTVSASSSNLTADDRVFVKFTSLDADGAPVVDSVGLTGAESWQAQIPAGTRFPKGSQFFTVGAVRIADGKTTAGVSGAVRFCPASDSSCSSSALPRIDSVTAPSNISLTAAGGLAADFTVQAVTRNVPATGRVQVIMPTRAGVQSVDLTATGTCELTGCTWSAVIPKAAGYAFKSQATSLYFSAEQPYTVAGPATEQGSTSSTSTAVTFA